MNVEPGPGESLDPLSLSRRVLQRARGHRSATDDNLAAWLAASARPDARRVLDLGCGHGTVTLLLSSVLPTATFVCVERQPVSADLARRNLRLNALEDRARVVEGDLRDFGDDLPFDLATGTPPFMPEGTGLLSQDPQRAAARFELAGGVEDYLAVAARVLSEDGAVCILMDGAQDLRCRRAFEGAGLFLHQTVAFRPRAGFPPRFRGYVGGRFDRAAPVLLPDVDLRDAEGGFSSGMRAIRRFLGVEEAAK